MYLTQILYTPKPSLSSTEIKFTINRHTAVMVNNTTDVFCTRHKSSWTPRVTSSFICTKRSALRSGPIPGDRRTLSHGPEPGLWPAATRARTSRSDRAPASTTSRTHRRPNGRCSARPALCRGRNTPRPATTRYPRPPAPSAPTPTR